MISGAHKHIKIKATDTIVFSSNPIPGNEPRVVNTVDGLLREGAQVIQNGKTHLSNIGPLHLSGHAYYEDHVEFVTRLQPKNYMPYHGEFYMLEHNAEMAENVIGIPENALLSLMMAISSNSPKTNHPQEWSDSCRESPL